MKLTVHRGTKEIGGSCVELATATTRLVLDAGLPLVDENREPFDSLKALRSTRDELIADGTIPPMPGLFSTDAAPPDAILLTHAHLDHSGLIHLSRPEIPVYATRGTSKMMLAGAVFQSARPRPKPTPGDRAGAILSNRRHQGDTVRSRSLHFRLRSLFAGGER